VLSHLIVHQSLLNPEGLLTGWGQAALWGAAAIVFAECGLLIGFFLPGDTLLFTVGMLVASGAIKQPWWVAALMLAVAALLGNVVGYEIGRAAGPKIFAKQDSKLFRREYVEKTHAFFEKYGSLAIVLARFVPIVRTFITVTAGVGQMDRRRYFSYSAVGGVLWVVVVTVLGVLLGNIPIIKNNIELMLVGVVVLSVVGLGVEWLRQRSRAGSAVN
jgi:membrane-associated protein